MAWATDLCEIQSGRVEIWGKYSLEGGYNQDVIIDRRDENIVFFGRVTDSEKNGASGVVVFVSACMEDGSEIPLAYTYSGKDGNYLLSVKNLDAGIEKYIIRSGVSV
ncbi:MAG: hypothetical protein ACOY30_07010 [Bacillota bacterium]